MTLDLRVAYALPDGDYNIVLTRSGAPEALDILHITGGAGVWSGSARAAPGATQIELVEIATGKTRCSAELRTV
jgi:hypothetical protein